MIAIFSLIVAILQNLKICPHFILMLKKNRTEKKEKLFMTLKNSCQVCLKRNLIFFKKCIKKLKRKYILVVLFIK